MMTASCSLINAGGPTTPEEKITADQDEIYEQNADMITNASNAVKNIVRTYGKYDLRSVAAKRSYPNFEKNLNTYATSNVGGRLSMGTYLDRVFDAVKDAYKAITNDPISKQSQPAMSGSQSMFKATIRGLIGK